MRGLRPAVDLRRVVEARLWNSQKQMEQVAKMVFYVGEFDSKYWDVGGLGEREFIARFVENYK